MQNLYGSFGFRGRLMRRRFLRTGGEVPDSCSPIFSSLFRFSVRPSRERNNRRLRHRFHRRRRGKRQGDAYRDQHQRQSHTVNTNESGNYIFADVPPGNYSVTVEMTGFKKEERRDISLLVNTTQRVDLQLQPGNVTETVEVTGAPPALQTDRADTGRNIDSMRCRNCRFWSATAIIRPCWPWCPARRRRPRSTPSSLTLRTHCRPKSTERRACRTTTRSRVSTTTSAPACCKS